MSKTAVNQGANVTKHNFEAMREAMVASQLRTTAVSDPRIVAVMQDVPREAFVPDEKRALAYVDIALPLSGTRAIPAPMVVGRLLTEAALLPTDRVLVVGAGTGYTAALLARLVASVVAVEEDSTLVSAARAALSGDSEVKVVSGPNTAGWAEGAPYDVVVIDGAVEFVPDALVSQLTDRGRVVCGLVDGGVTRLALGRKAGGHVGLIAFADAEVPVLPGFARAKTFTF